MKGLKNRGAFCLETKMKKSEKKRKKVKKSEKK
jgi:hypothetical protein